MKQLRWSRRGVGTVLVVLGIAAAVILGFIGQLQVAMLGVALAGAGILISAGTSAGS